MSATFKAYAKRDSATAALRKMGIDKANYNEFIVIGDDGEYFVDLESAKASLVKPPKQLVVPAKKDPEVKAVKQTSKKDVEGTKETVSSVSRQLIKDGKTNKEAWEIIKAKFDLDDSKKSYPAWYRSQMTRDGTLK